MLDGSLELLSTFDCGRLLFKGETPPLMISVSGITGCTGNPRVRAFRDGQLIEPVSCGFIWTTRYLFLLPSPRKFGRQPLATGIKRWPNLWGEGEPAWILV